VAPGLVSRTQTGGMGRKPLQVMASVGIPRWQFLPLWDMIHLRPTCILPFPVSADGHPLACGPGSEGPCLEMVQHSLKGELRPSWMQCCAAGCTVAPGPSEAPATSRLVPKGSSLWGIFWLFPHDPFRLK
jgi:hypothetical protein